MTSVSQDKRGLLFRGLIVAALVLLALAYFSPIWWVSLKAPNYPPEAFPSGVKIHFHMNGVFNGCTLQARTDIREEEALDCVHEMDAINHFVGMYPIASGGVVERAFSPFLMTLVGVMLIGFLFTDGRVRTGVLAVGFGGLAAWMSMTYYGTGGIQYQTGGYLSSMVTSLGQGKEEAGEELSPVIAQLRESLRKSGGSEAVDAAAMHETLRAAGETRLSEALSALRTGSGAGKVKTLKQILEEAEGKSGREVDLSILRSAFEADQARAPAAARQEWTGSGQQVLFWHYEKALGRWFNNPDEIRPLVAAMKTAGTVVFWGILAAMVFLTVVTARTRSVFYWLLVIGPIVLPAAFVAEYSAWLWWYGHSLNDMGAFTLKPFMPTVLGQGKVAQFSTYSYPHYGFALIAAAALLTLLAALIRRKQMQGGQA